MTREDMKVADTLFNTIYNPDVLSCIANLSNDEVFTPPEVANAMLDMLLPVLKDIGGERFLGEAQPINGSEDFGNIMERVPSVMFWLGAGTPADGYNYGIHKPQMTVCEDAMPVGAAMHAACAVKWLEENS